MIKEKKSLLPPADVEGKRPVTPLDGEIAALEAVRWPGVRLGDGGGGGHRESAPVCSRRPEEHGRQQLTGPAASRPLPTPQERKELIGKKLNEQHSNWGHLLLGLGVTISIAGAFNTFLRTGACRVGWAGGRVEAPVEGRARGRTRVGRQHRLLARPACPRPASPLPALASIPPPQASCSRAPTCTRAPPSRCCGRWPPRWCRRCRCAGLGWRVAGMRQAWC